MESGPALKTPAKKRKTMLKSIPQLPVIAKMKNAPADNSIDNPVPNMLLPLKNLKRNDLLSTSEIKTREGMGVERERQTEGWGKGRKCKRKTEKQ